MDKEISAMSQIIAALKDLDHHEQRRVLIWMDERIAMGIPDAPRVRSLRNTSSEEEVAELPVDFVTSGEISLRTDGDVVELTYGRGTGVTLLRLGKYGFDRLITEYMSPMPVDEATNPCDLVETAAEVAPSRDQDSRPE